MDEPTKQALTDQFTKQYESTRSWFEYANGQAYNSCGWAIAAAFAIFIYVMKDAKEARDKLMVPFAIAASILLVAFAGLTAAGWAAERDAAYKNIVRMEKGGALIVSQDPRLEDRQRTGTFGSWPLECTIDAITVVVGLGFAVGGYLRLVSLPKG